MSIADALLEAKAELRRVRRILAISGQAIPRRYRETCKRGHVSDRYTNGCCVQCQKEHSANQYRRFKQRMSA